MKGFGIRLEPLSGKTLELVRQWRNDAVTSRFMEFRNEITPEAQQKWFDSIRNAYYFVIFSGPTPVGLIDLKKIDVDRRTAESGLLIGNKDFIGTGIALGASVLLLDFAFDRLALETVTAKISRDNSEAERYNGLLGFRPGTPVNERFQNWVLTKAAYFEKRNSLLMFLE